MPASITTRARWLLAATATGIIFALLTVPLLASARADRAAAQTLTSEELAFASAVTEMRTLALELRLDAALALLRPPDDSTLRANGSRRAVLADEIRRARVHAADLATVDVIDDFANTALRLDSAADRIFSVRDTVSAEDALALSSNVEIEGADLNDLAEELTTIAATATARRVDAVAGTSRLYALALFLVGALALAACAGMLAWLDSGPAITTRISRAVPGLVTVVSFRRSVRTPPEDSASVRHVGTASSSTNRSGTGDPSESGHDQSILLNLREQAADLTSHTEAVA